MTESPSSADTPGSEVDVRRVRLELYERLVRFQQRVDAALEEVRAESEALFPDLPEEERVRWEAAGSVPQLRLAVAEVEELVRRTEARLKAEVNLLRGAVEGGEEPLPPGLARFVAERSITPGFEYTVESDPLKGRILRWRVRTTDGWIRSAGLLPESPYAWLDE